MLYHQNHHTSFAGSLATGIAIVIGITVAAWLVTGVLIGAAQSGPWGR